MKKIGFVAAGFCFVAGLFILIADTFSAIYFLRMGENSQLIMLIRHLFHGTALIMLAIFIGMLARKLK